MAISFWRIRHLAFILYMLRGLTGLRIHIFREIKKSCHPFIGRLIVIVVIALAIAKPCVSSASVSLSTVFLLVKFP